MEQELVVKAIKYILEESAELLPGQKFHEVLITLFRLQLMKIMKYLYY